MTLRPLPHVGWTASRHGLSPIQQAVARIVLTDLRDRRGATTLHHGDCVGGDAVGVLAALKLRYRIVGHPPVETKLRAYLPTHEDRAALHYLARDQQIVNESSILLGWPNTEEEIARSGTWATIRMARRAGLPRLVITPSGRVFESHGVEGLWTTLTAGSDDGGKESA